MFRGRQLPVDTVCNVVDQIFKIPFIDASQISVSVQNINIVVDMLHALHEIEQPCKIVCVFADYKLQRFVVHEIIPIDHIAYVFPRFIVIFPTAVIHFSIIIVVVVRQVLFKFL